MRGWSRRSVPLARAAALRRGWKTGDGQQRWRTSKSLQGHVLSDSEVLHVFTVNTGLIAAMDPEGETDPTAGPSAAFTSILTGYPPWSVRVGTGLENAVRKQQHHDR